ncbi:kelch-like protein 7 [Entelurus aequoreus]|uniref:kelch-like protein 7 n=1 Tax=Entelurus aequoreus TaxID=161455 RepID=UPI002B1E0AEF|nr:kelch-like protein 7 [Entelurus aequoreus]
MAPSSQKKRRNDCVCENSKLLSRTMGAMDSLRKQGSYCDVVLVVKGKHFPAHKVVLAATSQFFNIMFTRSMKESKSREVELQSAEPEVTELMLQFIYTAETSVKRSNAMSLLDVANQYQIEPLKNICEEFLKGQLDATNCLGFLSLADSMDCPELKSEAQNFLQEHLTEVCKMEEFSQLSVEELKHLLHQNHRFRPTVDEGGYSGTDIFQCYDTRTQTWEAKSSMLMGRCNHGSVEANGLIYVCGGSVGNPVSGTVIDDCEAFDPSTQEWRSLAAMKEPRKNHGLAVIDNTIYAFGGRGEKGPLNTVECYDIASDTWNAALRMPLCGETVKCAVVRDVVYVFVGHKGASRLGRVMEYHTNGDRWMTNYEMFHMPTSLVCAFKTCGGGNEEHRVLLGDSQEPSR